MLRKPAGILPDLYPFCLYIPSAFWLLNLLRAMMREFFILLFNVVVAMAAFVAGAAVHSALGFGLWFAPLTLLPCGLWFWWRGAVSRGALLSGLCLASVFTLYLALMDQFWPNQPEWFRSWHVPLLGLVIYSVCSLAERFKGTTQSSA